MPKEKVVNDTLHSAQLRAARGLVNWSRDYLAGKSGSTARTIARIEDEDATPRGDTVRAIRTALEKAGVEFIPENGGGPGVRLAKQKAKR
jgi:transcriptional regulator with XRE-family HTH domain